MAQTIQIKRSSSTATPTSLSAGELAYSDSSDKLFIGQPSNNTVVPIGGKHYTDILDNLGAGTGLSFSSNTFSANVDGTNSEAPQNSTNTTGRTYKVQVDSSDNLVVNVPWTDDDTLFSAGTGLGLSSTTFSLDVATGSALGGVKIGSGISVTGDGTISADQVDATAVSNAGALMTNGGTMTGDLEFNDAKKIKLGNDGDLEIFHAANRSAIMDKGTGNLDITTNGTSIRLRGGNDNNDMLVATSNGAVEIYHGGQKKFESTASGTEVTGNIVVSGTVDGRDLANDGTKLDGIETSATADQTDAEIKTAYENNSDTNAFTDADETKLDGISAGADVTPSWVPSTNPNYITLNTLSSATNVNFSNITITGDTIKSGSTLTLDPEAHVGDAGAVGTVVIEGDLRVKGTTTTVDSNTVSIGDAILLLNSDQAAANATSTDDAGLEVKRGTDSSELNAFLVWDESADRWSVDPGTGTLSPINVENVAIDGGTF